MGIIKPLEAKPVTYHYKFDEELLWGLITAVMVVIGDVLVSFDPAVITDWQTWALGVVGAIGRAIGAALIAHFGRGVVTRS